jgi:hypothetical protein
MTESDIQCLKVNIGKVVEIQTVDGEQLTARIISVFDEEDQPDVFYEVVTSNTMDWYLDHADSGGFALALDRIISVKPVTDTLADESGHANPPNQQ